MGIVHVRPASQGGPCAVRHPEHGEYVVPNPAQPYDTEDPLVKAYPWLFLADSQIDAAGPPQPLTEVAIEAPRRARRK